MNLALLGMKATEIFLIPEQNYKICSVVGKTILHAPALLLLMSVKCNVELSQHYIDQNIE